jgi:uncharacterized repeat protein (TIGR03803 family)
MKSNTSAWTSSDYLFTAQSGLLAEVKALAILFVLTLVASQSALAQTFTVIHNFKGGQDGEAPVAGLTMDLAGSIYGTTYHGGSGSGTVYKLSYRNSAWTLTTLYDFKGGSDGDSPLAGVIFDSGGSLYGTTEMGGGSNAGTVFRLSPPASVCKSTISCLWTETVLYRFQGGSDAELPNYGDIVFDRAGNIYGVTIIGGPSGQGTVYELTPSKVGWTERVLYAFSGLEDGAQPFAGLTIRNDLTFYGATQIGGNNGFGTLYQLTSSGSSWVEKTLYTFQGGRDGAIPVSTLILDQSGNLYGHACFGAGGAGTVYEFVNSIGRWTFRTIHTFNAFDCPWAGLTRDAAGNLYGTTATGGDNQGICFPSGCGTVYKLTRSNGFWTYTDLHDFNGFDGQNPYGKLVLDANGNLLGTAANGGTGGNCLLGCGVVFKIKL